MTLSECITILTEHNAWRRGQGVFERPHSPEDLGQAIDYAIEILQRLKAVQK